MRGSVSRDDHWRKLVITGNIVGNTPVNFRLSFMYTESTAQQPAAQCRLICGFCVMNPVVAPPATGSQHIVALSLHRTDRKSRGGTSQTVNKPAEERAHRILRNAGAYFAEKRTASTISKSVLADISGNCYIGIQQLRLCDRKPSNDSSMASPRCSWPERL